MWVIAPILEGTDIEHSHYYRKLYQGVSAVREMVKEEEHSNEAKTD